MLCALRFTRSTDWAGNPWIVAQSADPCFAQRNPWIVQIHVLRLTYPSDCAWLIVWTALSKANSAGKFCTPSRILIDSRAYREKRACNAQTTKFLLLIKLTFTPTRMWHHEKSMNMDTAGLATDHGRTITSHHERETYECMHSAHQFSTESTHSWQRLRYWQHRWWLPSHW